MPSKPCRVPPCLRWPLASRPQAEAITTTRKATCEMRAVTATTSRMALAHSEVRHRPREQQEDRALACFVGCATETCAGNNFPRSPARRRSSTTVEHGRSELGLGRICAPAGATLLCILSPRQPMPTLCPSVYVARSSRCLLPPSGAGRPRRPARARRRDAAHIHTCMYA